VTGEGEGEVRQVVGVDLRLVGARRHDPVAVLADTDALAGLLKAKVLQQLDAVGKLRVVFQTPAQVLVEVLVVSHAAAYRLRRRMSHSGRGRASLPLIV
jgi:hypothetical protein